MEHNKKKTDYEWDSNPRPHRSVTYRHSPAQWLRGIVARNQIFELRLISLRSWCVSIKLNSLVEILRMTFNEKKSSQLGPSFLFC